MTTTILGIDTGGTFTDFVLFQNGGITTHKVPSTPADPALAILNGISRFSLVDGNFEMIHGSTVATNSFLEHKTAKVALITTHGFEDIIEIGRQNRPDLYDLNQLKDPPLVEASRRFSVRERIDYRGKIISPIQLAELEEIRQRLQQNKVDAIAVSLLFSYKNSRHERIIKDKLKSLSLPLSLSSEILPEFREYERTCVTVLNASLSPVMANYLQSLKTRSKARKIRIMQSNGGLVSIDTARNEAVRTLLSGPAGGIAGARYVAHQAKHKRIITFDMGGTSTDVCLIDKEIQTVSSTELQNIPIAMPMLPIHTVGSGGGSKAWIDPGGALQVGPQSAGADPGPVCYGKGSDITITDAHLYLGRIHPKSFLGGAMNLYPERVIQPMKQMAASLKMTPDKLAKGIIAIANTHMENAIRVISTQKGFDPRDFTLVPFGGAGGLHACEMARHLGIKQILIPQNPGLLSALGMALSPTIKDYSQTILVRDSTQTKQKIEKTISQLKMRALSEIKRERIPPREIEWKPSLDLRYEGQSFEINVPLEKDYGKQFLNRHRKLYGYVHKDHPIEIVTVRLKAVGPERNIRLQKLKATGLRPQAFDKRPFSYNGEKSTLPFYWRDTLGPGASITGPAVICEYSATTFIPPDFKGKIDEWGNLILYAR